jgi:hypothetical protein
MSEAAPTNELQGALKEHMFAYEDYAARCKCAWCGERPVGYTNAWESWCKHLEAILSRASGPDAATIERCREIAGEECDKYTTTGIDCYVIADRIIGATLAYLSGHWLRKPHLEGRDALAAPTPVLGTSPDADAK